MKSTVEEKDPQDEEQSKQKPTTVKQIKQPWFRKKRVPDLTVDKNAEESLLVTPGFSRAIFSGNEWETLKMFCQKYDIEQRDLVMVFKVYLSSDEAYIRDFRVKFAHLKVKFLGYSRVTQEIADAFIPCIYRKDLLGLSKPIANEECSFTRFCIVSFMFGGQAIVDLIYEFFAAMYERNKLHMKGRLFAYNLFRMTKLLTEDFPNYGVKIIVLKFLRAKNEDEEILYKDIVQMAVKYPIMFYQLQRFRNLFKRTVFGDKFWNPRPMLAAKLSDRTGYADNAHNRGYLNENIAVIVTAISIISDVYDNMNNSVHSTYTVTKNFVYQVDKIDEELCTELKQVFGYKLARRLIEESELPYDFHSPFMKWRKYWYAPTSVMHGRGRARTPILSATEKLEQEERENQRLAEQKKKNDADEAIRRRRAALEVPDDSDSDEELVALKQEQENILRLKKEQQKYLEEQEEMRRTKEQENLGSGEEIGDIGISADEDGAAGNGNALIIHREHDTNENTTCGGGGGGAAAAVIGDTIGDSPQFRPAKKNKEDGGDDFDDDHSFAPSYAENFEEHDEYEMDEKGNMIRKPPPMVVVSKKASFWGRKVVQSHAARKIKMPEIIGEVYVDEETNRSFQYDESSGKRAWALRFFDEETMELLHASYY